MCHEVIDALLRGPRSVHRVIVRGYIHVLVLSDLLALFKTVR